MCVGRSADDLPAVFRLWCVVVTRQIEVERAHETLIDRWRTQLEQKQREIEALHASMAPPKDLEVLRAKIQEELEIPHGKRIEELETQARGACASLAYAILSCLEECMHAGVCACVCARVCVCVCVCLCVYVSVACVWLWAFRSADD